MDMAQTIALILTANSETIEGDSTISSDDRENTIEVLSLTHTLHRAFDRASARATLNRFYDPLSFTKRLDRATPRLRQALAQNSEVAGQFRWFRPSPAGDGTVEHFMTLAFRNGLITSATMRLPDVLGAGSADLPPLEEIELVANIFTWTWEPGSIEFEDQRVAIP
jgi:type VI secretion system secreted protein Hcp